MNEWQWLTFFRFLFLLLSSWKIFIWDSDFENNNGILINKSLSLLLKELLKDDREIYFKI